MHLPDKTLATLSLSLLTALISRSVQYVTMPQKPPAVNVTLLPISRYSHVIHWQRNEKTTNYEQNVSVILNVATFLFIQKDSLLRRCTNGWAKWRDARINVAPFSKLFSFGILSCHRWKVKFSSSKKMIGRSSILSIFLVNIFVFTILAETKEKCTFVLL